jgi:hypothetical protein
MPWQPDLGGCGQITDPHGLPGQAGAFQKLTRQAAANAVRMPGKIYGKLQLG